MVTHGVLHPEEIIWVTLMCKTHSNTQKHITVFGLLVAQSIHLFDIFPGELIDWKQLCIFACFAHGKAK